MYKVPLKSVSVIAFCDSTENKMPHDRPESVLPISCPLVSPFT